MIVSVTKRDIAMGIPKDSLHCAIAIAASRAAMCAVDVIDGEIKTTEGELAGVPFPKPVVEFILDFDGGVIVFPFRFRIANPYKVRKGMAK